MKNNRIEVNKQNSLSPHSNTIFNNTKPEPDKTIWLKFVYKSEMFEDKQVASIPVTFSMKDGGFNSTDFLRMVTYAYYYKEALIKNVNLALKRPSLSFEEFSEVVRQVIGQNYSLKLPVDELIKEFYQQYSMGGSLTSSFVFHPDIIDSSKLPSIESIENGEEITIIREKNKSYAGFNQTLAKITECKFEDVCIYYPAHNSFFSKEEVDFF